MEQTATMYFCDDDDDESPASAAGTASKENEYGI